MSELMGKETKQNSSKSDKKNINHIDNSIESQTDGPGSILEIKDLKKLMAEISAIVPFYLSGRRKKSTEPHFLSDKRRRISGAVRQERMRKKYAVKTYEDTADTARKTKRRNPF